MRIAYLAAGAAGMYCGTCLHDNTLAAELIAQGDEVLLIPTYTPLRTDEPSVSQRRIFFGGINVYLQEKLALFRRTPWWLDRLFDLPALLNFATRGAASTDPAQLGGLTESILQGERGRQAKELDKLVAWLADEVRPEVVHLSNAMLLGMARRIRERLGVPIVSSLSGEDVFLERLTPPHYRAVRKLLVERAADADAFVAMNRYYADFMIEYLQIDPLRVRIIPHGLNLQGHRAGSAAGPRAASSPPLTIGYFARICHDKGLHLLIEALIRLTERGEFPPSSFRLKFAGYLSPTDRPYLARIEARLHEAGLGGHYEYAGELDRAAKIVLLQSFDVMCLPTVYKESKGLSLYEAWANGVPAIVPRHGTFPELIADTGAGLLFEPENVDSLVAALETLLRDADLRARMGTAGLAAVADRFHAGRMAEETRRLYQSVVHRSAM